MLFRSTTSSAEKGEVLKKLGATHVINYKENTAWDQEVLKLVGSSLRYMCGVRLKSYIQTNGRGVDHVVEVRTLRLLLS